MSTIERVAALCARWNQGDIEPHLALALIEREIDEPANAQICAIAAPTIARISGACGGRRNANTAMTAIENELILYSLRRAA